MTAEKKSASKRATSKTKTSANTLKKSRVAEKNRRSGSSKGNRVFQAANEYRLIEGRVDPAKEHIGIRFGDDEKIIARIAPGQGKTFIVEYLVRPDLFNWGKGGMLDEVKRDIKYILVDIREENPWAYARYHCGTAANIYSPVHWAWYPDSSVSAEQRQRYAMNRKRVFVCPACKSKFIVSGNVSFTCPECKKAELVPFTKEVAAGKKTDAKSRKRSRKG